VRVLFSSTRGIGHFRPLLPFIAACGRRGHEVLVAGPPELAGPVAKAGHGFWEFDSPREEDLGPLWARVPDLPIAEQNDIVVGDIFAGLNVQAALPRLREACREWQPDVIVREGSEFASAVAAEEQAIPHVRVGFGLASVEDFSLRFATRSLGPDMIGAIRRSPFFSIYPAGLEDPDHRAEPDTHRFAVLPGPYPVPAGGPLVYVTLGSTGAGTGQKHPVYERVLSALAGLPVRALLTMGGGEPLSDVPANVRVESWVDEAEVLPKAAAVLCHGGAGSTLAAIAAGRPLVLAPLFGDQPTNAERVQASGAGLAVAPDPHAIRTALARVLAEASFAANARRLANELRDYPSADVAVDRLQAYVGRVSALTNSSSCLVVQHS